MTTSSSRLIAVILLGLFLLLLLAPALGANVDPLEQARAAIDEQRYSEAVELIVPLARNGDATAQNMLGILYGQGWGVDKDLDKARQWFEQAAAGGSGRAFYNLASMYATGNGVPKDCARAVELLRTPAQAGDPVAQVNLGSLYADGSECTPQDFDEAIRWYRMAAEQNDPLAQHSLGAFYATGQGVEQSYATAMEWYKKAAAQGYANSQMALGWMYFAGEGVEPDVDKACEWLKLAADQGHEMASECLEAITEGTAIGNIDEMVEAYLAAPAKDVAASLVSLESLSMMVDLGVNVITPHMEINDSNREQVKVEIATKREALSRVVEIRGAADIAGAYTAEATSSCAKIQSMWAGGIREGFLGGPTFEQDGHAVTMTQMATANGRQPMETPVVIVEDVLVFTDIANSDFMFAGVVDGNVISVTPDTESILAAWPDWVKAPSRKNLDRCKVTLTRQQ